MSGRARFALLGDELPVHGKGARLGWKGQGEGRTARRTQGRDIERTSRRRRTARRIRRKAETGGGRAGRFEGRTSREDSAKGQGRGRTDLEMGITTRNNDFNRILWILRRFHGHHTSFFAQISVNKGEVPSAQRKLIFICFYTIFPT